MARIDELQKQIRSAYYNESDSAKSMAEPLDRQPDDTKAKKLRKETIERLSASLVAKRDVAVRARASCGIEQIWREDELAFEGWDEEAIRTRMIDYATQTAPVRSQSNKGPRRSKVVINVIRPKCETAEGRFSDIVLPTDDKNWALKITPVPELEKGMKDTRPAQLKGANVPLLKENGEAQTISDVAMADIETAKEKMAGMEAEIDDQLTECNFNGECRKVIRNAIRLGTGILKGPMVVKDLKKTWQEKKDEDVSVQVLKRSENLTPASKSCDPWDCFPDPECRENTRKMAYMWEREAILQRELRDLKGVEGYLTDEIEAVLRESPQRVVVATPKENQYIVRYNTVEPGNTYEKWEYNGELNREDLEALGCDCSAVAKSKSVSACVVMVNSHTIKAMLNPQDTGEIPYDIFQWSSRTSVPWGMSEARKMAWQQRVINAAWRAMMDNAGDSSGGMLGVGPGVEPADGVWEVTGKKIWRGDDSQQDMRKAFHMVQVDNNQDALQKIIELALRFLDIETNMPMLFTGEKGELPKTLGQTNIMVDSNNIAVRARVKLWDDFLTRPHITRYYDYNMQYHPNEKIKGDFKVDPRGISVLLERDRQIQDIKEIFGLKVDPEINILIDWEKAIKQVFKARNLDIINTPEKIIENRKKLAEKPPPTDPALETAKIRAEGDLKKARITEGSDMAELEFKAQQAAIDREHELQVEMIKRDVKMMELSVSSGIALDKIKAELSEVGQKLKVQVALAKDKNVRGAEQVSTPPTEPAGRAKEGMAFQE